MRNQRKKLPGVLLLLLSALGFLFSLSSALLILLGLPQIDSASLFADETQLIHSLGFMALAIGLLNLPAFLFSIRYLRGKPISVRCNSLFFPASLSLILWVMALVAGYFASKPPGHPQLLACVTVFAVILPIWWLVEFSRRGLPRSNAVREWGALSVGLTAAPLLIIILEVLLLVLVGVAVFTALSAQPEALRQFSEIMQNIERYQDSLEQLEKLIYDLAQNPLITRALFLVIGLLAPLIEEFIKPMAVWFLLKRQLKPYEGFSLGLISGGAFALLESAGLVGQIGAEVWLTAVILRAATALLHIGLSGLVGYGLVLSWNQKAFARAFLYWLAASALHGAWNSLALLSGFTATSIPASATEFQPTPQSVLPFLGMFLVFASVIAIVIHLNRHLRKTLVENESLLEG